MAAPTDSYEGFLNWEVFFALIRLALAGDARATFPQGKAGVTYCLPGLPAYVHRSDSMGMTCFFRLMIRGRKAVFSFGVTLKA